MIKVPLPLQSLPEFERLPLFLFTEKRYLAGGSLRTVFDNTEPIQDLDVFFADPAEVQKAAGMLVDAGFSLNYACPSLQLFTYTYDQIKVQLIAKEYYNSAEDLITKFDFYTCAAAWDGEHLYYMEEFAESVAQKVINIQTVTYPAATMRRIHKYLSKGYRIPKEQIVEYLQQVRQLPEEFLDYDFYPID